MSDGKNRESLLLPILIPFGALAVIGLALFGFSRVLLSVSHHAATAVALGAAIAIMAIASFVATRKKVSSSSLAGLAIGVVGSCMLIGGIAIVAIGPEPTLAVAVKPQVLTLTAPPGASANGFASTTLSAAPGKPIQIVLDNQESGVSHNVAVYASDPTKDPSAALFGSATPVPGPAKLTVPVKALEAGSYFFRCDVHPATMQGVLTVAEGGAGAGGVSSGAPSGAPPTTSPSTRSTPTSSPSQGGGSGATAQISAQGLQFSASSLTLPAATSVTLTFDNQDAGIPHNVAIYSDSGYTKAVFTGDIVTGPVKAVYDVPALDAGTYYFRCDVHTTMTGTVTVK